MLLFQTDIRVGYRGCVRDGLFGNLWVLSMNVCTNQQFTRCYQLGPTGGFAKHDHGTSVTAQALKALEEGIFANAVEDCCDTLVTASSSVASTMLPTLVRNNLSNDATPTGTPRRPSSARFDTPGPRPTYDNKQYINE